MRGVTRKTKKSALTSAIRRHPAFRSFLHTDAAMAAPGGAGHIAPDEARPTTWDDPAVVRGTEYFKFQRWRQEERVRIADARAGGAGPGAARTRAVTAARELTHCGSGRISRRRSPTRVRAR